MNDYDPSATAKPLKLNYKVNGLDRAQTLRAQPGEAKEEDQGNTLSPQELKCITQFFDNFIIVSETSLHEHLDIVLFLRAVSERITL